MSEPPRETSWPVGWQGAAAAELSAVLRSTPAQRLAWLEEARRFVWSVGAWPKIPPRIDDPNWRIEPEPGIRTSG